MPKQISLDHQVTEDLAGLRLDQAAAALFPDYSRARLQQWIKKGELTVDGSRAKPSARLAGGEQLRIEAQMVPEGEVLPQDIPLDIVFEDEHLLVVNKPAGLVVHPAAGNWDGTLQNALLNFDKIWIRYRARESCIAWIRIPAALWWLHAASKRMPAWLTSYKTRSMSRIYAAVVKVKFHQQERSMQRLTETRVTAKKMAVVKGGRSAISHYRLLQRLPGTSYIEVSLESGRTHQIRVHMTHIGYPIVGDLLYGRGPIKQKGLPAEAVAAVNGFPRQALHARTLKLIHPDTGEACEFNAPLAEDISGLINVLAGSND